VLAGVLSGYLLGCLSAGYYLVGWRTGTDLRSTGSGSTGARNAGRVLGTPGFVLTFLFDVAKGAAAVLLARSLGEPALLPLAGLAAVAGHVWPVQLRFRGGRGIAPALGALLMLDPLVVAVLVPIAAAAFLVVRRAEAAGFVAVAASPILAAALGRPPLAVATVAALAGILLFTHRRRLWPASPPRPLRFKVANEDAEFEQIHRLNYRTFVEEIPQHERNPERRLVDAFHAENTYVICLAGPTVVGMLCVRGNRPFSLDRKLPDLDAHLPPGRRVCEIRLLAVEKEYRRGRVFHGLMKETHDLIRRLGYDAAVISGTTRQLRLYAHLGFVPFGPRLGSGDAVFQGMLLTVESFRRATAKLLRDGSTLNLLPGPIPISARVQAAMGAEPVSHRSVAFVRDVGALKTRLCQLVNAPHVAILTGSGTLANDAVAARLEGPGLVLVNGEFGRRLADHAERWALDHRVLEREWGETLGEDGVLAVLETYPTARWIWAVHHETSTGVLNDLAMLKRVARQRGLLLALDAISSIGLVPVDLAGVALATGVSGKGLASVPGLSLVFSHSIPDARRDRPRALDLGPYAAADGVPFTLSSNLLYALKASVDEIDAPRRFAALEADGRHLRRRLEAAGLDLVAPEEAACFGVTTIRLPAGLASESVGRSLESAGFTLSYRSDYLLARNWIQICLMAEHPRERLEPLLDLLGALVAKASPMEQAGTLVGIDEATL